MKVLPDDYTFTFIPRDAELTFRDPNDAFNTTPRKASSSIVISCSYNVAAIVAAMVQTCYAILTLYRARGNQISRYGFTAFGLTVAPYAVMSIVNLLGSLSSPSYPAMYLVRSNAMTELEEEYQYHFESVVGTVLPAADSSYGRDARGNVPSESAQPQSIPVATERNVTAIAKPGTGVAPESLPLMSSSKDVEGPSEIAETEGQTGVVEVVEAPGASADDSPSNAEALPGSDLPPGASEGSLPKTSRNEPAWFETVLKNLLMLDQTNLDHTLDNVTNHIFSSLDSSFTLPTNLSRLDRLGIIQAMMTLLATVLKIGIITVLVGPALMFVCFRPHHAVFFVVASIPLVVIGALTHFSFGESTPTQGIWISVWYLTNWAAGLFTLDGSFFLKFALIFGEALFGSQYRAILSNTWFSDSRSLKLFILLGYSAPAVGVFVGVARMIDDYGDCRLLD